MKQIFRVMATAATLAMAAPRITPTPAPNLAFIFLNHGGPPIPPVRAQMMRGAPGAVF